MSRWLLFAFAFRGWAALAAPGNELPQHQEGEIVPGESALFLNDPSDPAGKRLAPMPDEAFLTPSNAAQADAEVQRLERKRQRWEHLVGKGILAPVEYEKVQAQSARACQRCAAAHLAEAERALTELRARKDPAATADEIQAAEQAVEAARVKSTEAATALQQVLLEQARRNVDRQKRLTAAGFGSQAQLRRAQETLAHLQAP